MAVALTVGLIISFRLLKLKAENSQSIFLKLNAISLLGVNLLCWGTVLILSPDNYFDSFSKIMITIVAITAIALPTIEEMTNKNKIVFIPIYILTAGAITMIGFDMPWQEAIIVAIFWGAFSFLFDSFNGPARIANNSLIVILLGLLFVNIFFLSSTAIIFLALITAIILFSFGFISKNEMIMLQMSQPALHGFAFLTGMFFAYFASLGYLAIAIIIPAYFIMEQIIFGIIVGYKKIFKKDTPTLYFFEKAITRGANYNAMNKYIAIMLCLFVMIAAVYNPRIIYLLLGCSVFIASKMILDFYKWGEKKLTLKETWKQTFTDAKLATEELKKNLIKIKDKAQENKENKENKKNKKDK